MIILIEFNFRSHNAYGLFFHPSWISLVVHAQLHEMQVEDGSRCQYAHVFEHGIRTVII